MQKYINQMIAEGVQLPLGIVAGKTQIKQMAVTGKEGIEILFTALSDLGFDDHPVIKGKGRFQRAAIGQGNEY